MLQVIGLIKGERGAQGPQGFKGNQVSALLFHFVAEEPLLLFSTLLFRQGSPGANGDQGPMGLPGKKVGDINLADFYASL